ncbi:M48 family metalloprotease [Sphingomonas sp. R-74633]|uniref:M48 family metallopeptidase n=1 Tax=Sphingomonas sp. R-74633 TaxID=2751188 RepID=UPI0015D3AD18|nr:M48 family metallopeptidase [Sphingomonas sp. R-74633]NYT39243.1 M48 family metalloprotease [Sphingomonas sp. R-74633]
MSGFIALAALVASPAQADDTSLLEAVRSADMRVAGIGWRLATANVRLCDRIEAGVGLQLHTLDQFDAGTRESARAHFRFATPVAVEGLLPDGPAERAGLHADDSLVRLGTVDIAALPGKPGSTDKLVAAQLAIAALPADAPIEVEAIRAGSPIRVTLVPVPACKSRFELELDGGFGASADGTMVQIGSGFLDDYSDDQLAAVIAHEFSHNILHHRDRLEARGVDYGLLAGFGANVQYFRQTEVQADLLSIYLLANADYPIRATVAFWKHFGPSKAGGILRSRSHPAWRDRVATLEAEAAKIEKLSNRPLVPALIADRGKPLDGDWQSILVRH